MSVLRLNERAAPATPASAKVDVWANSDANPQMKFIDDAGNVRTMIDDFNTATLANKTATGLTLTAGSATVPALDFAAGTNMTTPAVGNIEFDGTCFYATATASNRGLNTISHLTCASADFTGTNASTAQPCFASTSDAITLPANTAYRMEGSYHIHTTGTTSHTLGILFGGTATLTSIGYQVQATNAATEVLGAVSAIWGTAATSIVVSAAAATATHHSIYLTGIIRIANAGTLIPQYVWSAAPGVAGVTLRGSYFMLTPLGGTTTEFVGNWA